MTGPELRHLSLLAVGYVVYIGGLTWAHWKLGRLPELSIMRRKGTTP